MSKKIRRINICGGPGIGKSGIAARLYATMKEENYSVELATEYVKGWAYLDRSIRPFDQFYLLNKQLQHEYVPLIAGVEYVVSDSPIFLPYCYATLDFDPRVADAILPIVELFDEEFEPLYIFLNRSTTYNAEGRFQDETKAKIIDERIKTCLEMRNKKFLDIELDDDIVSIVKGELNKHDQS